MTRHEWITNILANRPDLTRQLPRRNSGTTDFVGAPDRLPSSPGCVKLPSEVLCLRLLLLVAVEIKGNGMT